MEEGAVDGKDVVIIFTSEGIGRTDSQDLRVRLTSTFLQLLHHSETLPKVICFYTDGVKLVCEGSPLLEELGALERQGVELVACTTCLTQFGLLDKVRVGVTGGMPDIITAMWRAGKVITV